MIQANLKIGGEGGGGASIRESVPLAPFTTFKVGGPSRYFFEASTESDLRAAIAWAYENGQKLFFLGGGSNLVVSDRGFNGLVIKINVQGIRHRHDGHHVYFDVGAGEDWDGFVAGAVAHNCSGIENLSGIPGTVGGTPVQNVGAYGQEVSETIESVRVLDLKTGTIEEIENAACGFAYRTSIFNSSERGRYVVLQVTYRLAVHGKPNLKYADLQKHFAGKSEPSLAEIRDAVRAIRLSKAMLIVEGDEDCRSAGSFFKNPIVSEHQADEVAAFARSKGIDREPPRYPAEAGQVKLSAAWLVEQSGFPKGYGKGPAGISRRHTLAIVNRGGAMAADILKLKDEVKTGVRDAFGVELHPEPVMVGF